MTYLFLGLMIGCIEWILGRFDSKRGSRDNLIYAIFIGLSSMIVVSLLDTVMHYSADIIFALQIAVTYLLLRIGPTPFARKDINQ